MERQSRVELFEQIRWARERELPRPSIHKLAERHGVHRRTVRQALENAVPPPRKRPEGRDAPKLGEYHPSVPLLAATRDLLTDWRAVGAHDEIMFPNTAGDGRMHAIHFDRKIWSRARKRAGVVEVNGREHDCSKMTFHQLRHTFASMCLAAGRDVWEVAHWIGDDPELVKRVYGHYIPDSIGDTSRLDAMLTITKPAKLAG